MCITHLQMYTLQIQMCTNVLQMCITHCVHNVYYTLCTPFVFNLSKMNLFEDTGSILRSTLLRIKKLSERKLLQRRCQTNRLMFSGLAVLNV